MQPTAVVAVPALVIALVAMVRLLLGMARTSRWESGTPTHESARVLVWQSAGILLLISAINVGLAAEVEIDRFPTMLSLLVVGGLAALVRAWLLHRSLR